MHSVTSALATRSNLSNQAALLPLSDSDTELDSNSENFDASTWSLDTYVVIFFLIFEICTMNMDDGLYSWCDDAGCFG